MNLGTEREMGALEAALATDWNFGSIGRRGVFAIPNVLIAHHDAYTRKLVEATLEGEGYTIRFAADGVDALSALRHASPDLLVIAKDLPELDASTVIRAMADFSGGQTPARVIVLGATCDELPADIRCYVHAALGLPFRPIMLLVTATELLGAHAVSDLARDSRSHLRVVS